MIKNELAVIVISDESLINNLSAHNSDKNSGASAKTIQYEYFSDIPSKQKLLSCDAIIYDVDIAKEPQDQLLKIHLDSNKTPLIAIGSRDTINELTSLASLDVIIDRAQPKPVSTSIFEIAVSMVTANKPSEASKRHKAQTTHRRPLALTIGSFLGLTILASIGYIIFSSDSKQIRSENIAGTTLAEQETVLEVSEQASKANLTEVNELVALAKRAHQSGQLAFPKDANAISYYQQALLLDRYDTKAYRGLQEALTDIRGSTSKLINSGELTEAEKLITVLTEVSPFDFDNEQLIARYKEAANNSLDLDEPGSSEQQSSVSQKLVTAETIADSQAISSELSQFSINNRQESVQDWSLKTAYNELAIDAEAGIEDAGRPATITKKQAQREPLRDEERINLEQQKLKENLAAVEKIDHKPSLEINGQGTTHTSALVLKRSNPKYPKRAIALGIEGWVEVSFQVDETGKVVNAKAIDGEPKGYFNLSGLRAINRWKFQPARDTVSGKSILSPVIVKKFYFKIG